MIRNIVKRILHHSDSNIADALNVLKSPDTKINMDGEPKDGNLRYRMETKNILVVVGFSSNGSGINIITAWDKRK